MSRIHARILILIDPFPLYYNVMSHDLIELPNYNHCHTILVNSLALDNLYEGGEITLKFIAAQILNDGYGHLCIPFQQKSTLKCDTLNNRVTKRIGQRIPSVPSLNLASRSFCIQTGCFPVKFYRVFHFSHTCRLKRLASLLRHYFSIGPYHDSSDLRLSLIQAKQFCEFEIPCYMSQQYSLILTHFVCLLRT